MKVQRFQIKVLHQTKVPYLGIKGFQVSRVQKAFFSFRLGSARRFQIKAPDDAFLSMFCRCLIERAPIWRAFFSTLQVLKFTAGGGFDFKLSWHATLVLVRGEVISGLDDAVYRFRSSEDLSQIQSLA